MSLNAETISTGELRNAWRQNFMEKFQNPKLQQSRLTNHSATEYNGEYFREEALKTEQNIQKLGESSRKQKNMKDGVTSGGDADRMLHYTTNAPHQRGDSCEMYNDNDGERITYHTQYLPHRSGNCSKKHDSIAIFPSKPLHRKYNPSSSFNPANDAMTPRKYQPNPAVDKYNNDKRSVYENDSNLGALGNESEDSAKSQKSTKTIVSRSSHELRKIVRSQCKLHEEIDQAVNNMCKTEVLDTVENDSGDLKGKTSTQQPLTMSPCKRCVDRLHRVQSEKDIMTEISKTDSRHNNPLTISLDDVINSRVINPMIHKIHRMYLNNLKEEMSLLEDLEQLPNKVKELYKSVIFKQKD